MEESKQQVAKAVSLFFNGIKSVVHVLNTLTNVYPVFLSKWQYY